MISGKFILQESTSIPDHVWIIIGITSSIILLILIFNAVTFCYSCPEYRFHQERSDKSAISSVTESNSEESMNDDLIV